MFEMMLFSLLLCVLIISVKSDINQEVYSECNQTISQKQFFLQSVGYPAGYPPNMNCDYNLKGHAKCHTEFHFQFLDFRLEFSANCSKDRLQIGNENLCGNLTGVRMYKADGNYLRLKFVSDSEISRKGFKLLVTRLPCEGNNNLDSSLKSKNVLSLNTNLNLPKCCANSYNARRFYLASPGFPYSNQVASDCVFQIYRANPNICRLRIHFNFFSLGMKQGMNCYGGFLEIDGKQICGCQTELDVISQFDQYWGNQPKIIRYKNEGYNWNNHYYYNNQFTGFAIEIIQDECPTRYSPSMDTNSNSGNSTKGEKVPEFYFYNDQLNRISWPNKTNAKYVNDDNNVKDKRAPEVKIEYYFFDAPDYEDSRLEPKYKEPRSYFETTSTDFLASNGNDLSKCYSWGIYQWNQLTNGVLWQRMPQCKNKPQPTSKCQEIRYYSGFLRNPGYPICYYNNLDCCYRFYKIEGYCYIKFYVHDFNVEYSPNCYKDAFILYNKNKYCGDTLRNLHFTFDMTNKQYEDIKFSTDSCYVGRGFNIQYEHLPCITATTPTTSPPTPPMTTPAPTPPPTPTPPGPCGGDIFLAEFNISFPNSYEQCTYTIRRAGEDICGLVLDYINVDLICALEFLSMQNRQVCGTLTGQSDELDFDNNDQVIVRYQRRVDQTPAMSNIVLRGRQKKCIDIPASRIIKL